MIPILGPVGEPVLARFAASNVLLAFDYDGTLAPIVRDPLAARMRPETSALLGRVAALYPTAIITGRSIADVLTKLDGIPFAHVVGNHGMEPGHDLSAYEKVMRDLTPRLATALVDVPGVELEDKRYSLSVHYRRARTRADARAAILRAIESLTSPVRVVLGKQVVNVLPAGAPHKGTALLALRAAARAETAIFVGDDVTDEDAFALDDEAHLLGIRVGAKRSSAARYVLPTQPDIDRLLERLVALRAAHDVSGVHA